MQSARNCSLEGNQNKTWSEIYHFLHSLTVNNILHAVELLTIHSRPQFFRTKAWLLSLLLCVGNILEFKLNHRFHNVTKDGRSVTFNHNLGSEMLK